MPEQSLPDRQRVAAVDGLTRTAKSAFEGWNPAITGRIIPTPVFRYLIPTKLLSAVPNPNSVGISVIKNDGTDTRFLVLEHNDSAITNIESLSRFEGEMSAYHRARHAGNQPTPLSFPRDVDPPHLEYTDELKGGFLTLNDRFLLEAYFSGLSSDHMHVTSYGDRANLHGRGIAVEFFDRFFDLARKLQYKYITSENFDFNIDFFTDKLGFSRLTTIPQTTQHVLRKNLRGEPIEDFDNITVAQL